MAIKHVVTRGFIGSADAVYFVPTRGYTSAVATSPEYGLAWVATDDKRSWVAPEDTRSWVAPAMKRSFVARESGT